MLFGIPKSASCVQRFDDSLNSAIHITYRISLRSSSLREPRDPLSKVVFSFHKNVNDSDIKKNNKNVFPFGGHDSPPFLTEKEPPETDIIAHSVLV